MERKGSKHFAGRGRYSLITINWLWERVKSVEGRKAGKIFLNADIRVAHKESNPETKRGSGTILGQRPRNSIATVWRKEARCPSFPGRTV